MKEFNIYIDESGDEGINRGSKYFILTAIIVEKKKDLSISKVVDKIKDNLELDIKNQLHWNKVKGFPNKKMIMEQVSNSDLTIINIVIYIIIFQVTCLKESVGMFLQKMVWQI